MAVTGLSVGVVGAGTAGAAAALLLARAGHRVDVHERVPDPRPVGAGITLQPTGQAALARLGLLAPVLARGARIDRLHAVTRRGRTVVDLAYRDVAADLYGLGLHRGVLFETLLDAVRAEPRVTLRTGAAIASTRRDGDGRWLATDAGEALGPFDLVVVADGSVSELHPHTAIPVRSRAYPWGALWFVGDDPAPELGVLRQWVDGARHLAGLLPTGRGPGGDRPLVSLFWSVRADRVPAWRAAGLAAWKAEVARVAPPAAPVLDQIVELDQVLFTQYRDVSMPRWHDDAMVFLGDAAHATSPQLGQGANLALWDALGLTDALAGPGPLAARLAAYTRARLRHLRYYQLATRALTPFFQSDSRALGWLRDVVFPASRWLGPLRRRMVRTMIGLDRGIVRRPLPLAELRALLAAPAV